MPDPPGPPAPLDDAREWYTLQEVAGVVGISRQAVHARVQKGQLEGRKVDGIWRVPSDALAQAIEERRAQALSLGSVRVLPVVPAPDSGSAREIDHRVARLEALVAELAEQHEHAQRERDRELARSRERGDRLKAALHQMVELLAGDLDGS